MFISEVLEFITQDNYFIFFILLCNLAATCGWILISGFGMVLLLPDIILTGCTSLILSSIYFPENIIPTAFGILVISYILKAILHELCHSLPVIRFLIMGLWLILLSLVPVTLGVILADKILLTYVPDFIVFALTMITGFILLTLMNIKYETSQKIKKLTHIEIDFDDSGEIIFFLLFLFIGMTSCALSQVLFDKFSIVNISLISILIFGLGWLYYFLGEELKVGHDI